MGLAATIVLSVFVLVMQNFYRPSFERRRRGRPLPKLLWWQRWGATLAFMFTGVLAWNVSVAAMGSEAVGGVAAVVVWAAIGVAVAERMLGRLPG